MPNQNAESGDPRSSTILRRPALQAKVGLGYSTIAMMIAAGTFPLPVRLGSRAVGWIEAEVDAWLTARAAERPGDSGITASSVERHRRA